MPSLSVPLAALVQRILGTLLTGVLVVTSAGAVTPAIAASPPLVPGESVGTDPDEEWWEGITIPTEGVLPAEESHPSLYGGEAAVDTWRARVAGEAPDPHGHYASRWAKVQADADGWAADDTASTNDDVKTKAAKATAFAWALTGEERYLDAAVANLAAAFDDIQQVDQYVASQMTNYAQAYDWVAADLDPQQDETVRRAVKRGATWLYDYLDSPGVRSHNHRSKAGAALGSWALAFSADPDAQASLDRALENMDRVFRYMFTEDGIYRDGGGYYWVFSIINVTPFLWQYLHVSGVDLFPAMRPAYQWQLETANPKGWTPNIEDGSYKATWLHTVAAAYAETGTELHPDASLGELFQWQFFASEWNPVRYPDDWTGARNQYYGWPDEIALYDSSLGEVKPADSTATRDMDSGPRGGATVFRSDWEYGDARTRYGYFNGVAMSNNHDHADGLQLTIEAENSILARDNGYGPEKFGSRNEWKGPEHHNVVTADGSAVGDPDPTRGFLAGETFGFAEKSASYFDDQDATHTRRVAFPGQEYFIVADQLRADGAKTWEAFWHGRGELEGSANRHTWTTEEGPWGGAAELHAFTLPSDAQSARVSDKFNPYGTGQDVGFDDYPDPSTDVEDTTGIRLTREGETADFLSVLVPSSVGGDTPATLDVGEGDTLGARIGLGDYTDRVVVARSAGTASADGVDAEAALAWVRSEGSAVVSWALHDGRSLTVDDTPLVTSDAPVTMSGTVKAARDQEFEVAGTGSDGVTLRIAAPAGRDLTQATLDGETVEAEMADGQVTVDLTTGGVLRLQFGEADAVPATPEGLTAEGGEGFVELDWDAVGTALGYEVLRGAAGEDEELVAETDAPRLIDRDVTDGTEYSYRVRAVNEAGTSDASAPVTVTPGSSAPAAPEGLTALARDAEVELSWLAAEGATKYHVLRGPSGQDLEPVAEGLTDAFWTDSEVVNGQSYDYAVVAVNDQGESPASPRVTAQPFTTPPDLPSGVVAERGVGEVRLEWSGGERADSFEVLRGELGEELVSVASGVEGRSWTDSDVEDGTGYVYRIVAVNSAGSSDPSVSVAAVPGCSLAYPLTGGGALVEAERFSAVSGEITAVDDLDRFGGAKIVVPRGSEYKNNPDLWTRYDLEVEEEGRYYMQLLGYGESGSNDSVTVSVDGETPFTMNIGTGEWSYRQSPRAMDLTEGSHVLRILSREDGAEVDRFVLSSESSIPDSVKMAEDAAVPESPECADGSSEPSAPEPVGMLAAAGGDGAVELRWSGSRLAESYRVLRDGEVVAEDVIATSWTDADVVNDTTYTYRVVATNRVGDSEPTTATFIPRPSGLTAHWNGEHPVVEWREVVGADSYVVRRTMGDDTEVVSKGRAATSFVDRAEEDWSQVCYDVAARKGADLGEFTTPVCAARRR